MFETVDLYCERLGSNFWAEPVNALTNVSFLIGAWLALLRAKRLVVMSPAVWSLLGLMCAIGFGSFSFHTFANNLTRVLDVLPILFFQLVYVWLYCREIARTRQIFAVAIVFSYLVAAILGRQFPHILNGSLIYAPAIVVLFGLGIYHMASRQNARFVVMGAALVFVASLACRTVDGVVCPYFPLGTHFLWHLFNGFVLYLLLRGFLANRTMARVPNHGMIPRDDGLL
jgi:hypothetical protein